ncbi:flagellin [Tepidanaerobacter sp. GT38]|uniref:flagellin n=1 Tax=Tepidanaerobacter sp. GT38 TaxID=2722793 RepID=UPI001F3FD7DD|nr:flagellin [Tepidanaerobacter sp. GT38]MCG1012974.1 flagellin [Tepidanaerobacter sp. GT38]
MFKKIKDTIKKYFSNRKGNEIVAIALVLIFIILAAAGPLRNLGNTTSEGVLNLNTQMEDVLSGD